MANERQAYYDAKQRCLNPNHKRYSDWGGRGIKFLFESFKQFIECVGERPEGYSIDRIDNNGHYVPGNVKWSSPTEQVKNRRVSKTNKFGIKCIRAVKAKGLITPTYQAYCYNSSQFLQLYSGPDFFEACCARKSYESRL